MTASFCIGVDLGTTNNVLAFAPIDESEAMIGVLPIPQVTAPGSVENRLSLPSFLFIPTSFDAAFEVPGLAGSSDGSTGVVGDYARRISAEQPDRVVVAAKSWLCNPNVDRRSAILPWDSPIESKVSPVDASTIYLRHLVETWNLRFPDAPFHEQSVVLTVPASFDPTAREWTRQAAIAAGFPESFVFLEEPQAALYNWVHAHNKDWRKVLREGDTLLVCDVGGGTTDLTLVRVEAEKGELTLNRLAVGNHLLVGGDNMDLALAHVASELFAQKGLQLNAWQSLSLWHSCRTAKEKLLGPNAPESFPLTVLGRGSKLIGGTVTAQLEKQAVIEALVDGFFPMVAATDRPLDQEASGFQELGLEYASDSAITRHISAFLQDHAQESAVGGEPMRVTHILFNGGVFNADPFRARILQTLASWREDQQQPVVLGGVEELDQAVACGATYYAWARKHGGLRIRGGLSRSYYIGIESSGPAIPGLPRPLHALCVAAHGMEEGTQSDVPSRPIGLKVGQKARFRFFTSTVRKQDRPGVLVKHWDSEELQEASPLEVTLGESSSDNTVAGTGTGAGTAATVGTAATSGMGIVPVQFHSSITELGVLELSCKGTQSDQEWLLAMNVREDAS
jgi:hypothetical protein